MHVIAGIAYTGAAAIALHPLRSAVTTVCLIVVLVPYLAGIGISQGIEAEGRISLDAGADLYVSGLEFGRDVALPESAANAIRAITGVEQVIPRIVGPVSLGVNGDPAVVVGLPLEHLPKNIECIEGRLFQKSAVPELVVGSELAKRLKVKPGDFIPPFYHSRQGERVSKIVGVFRSDAALWQAHVIVGSIESAQRIFDQPAKVTQFLVNCRPGYEESVRQQIEAIFAEQLSRPEQSWKARIVARDELLALLPRSVLHRQGIFNLHFVLIFVAAMLVILVTSGMGLPERRREIGILKATGWQTDEILLRHSFESLLLGLLGAGLSILIAYGWLKGLNGLWIAGLFLSGAGTQPGFPVPFRLTPIPALLALILSLVLVMLGTLIATWRAAIVPPREAMR